MAAGARQLASTTVSERPDWWPRGAIRRLVSALSLLMVAAGAPTALTMGTEGNTAIAAKVPTATTGEIRTVGPLYRPGAGSKHTCTASVVSSPHHNLLLTAAHCLRGRAAGYVIAPGYHHGRAPYGRWRVTAAYLDPDWLADQDPRRDFAFLKVAPHRSAGHRTDIEDVVGANKLGSKARRGERVTVAGYSAGTDNDSTVPRTHAWQPDPESTLPAAPAVSAEPVDPDADGAVPSSARAGLVRSAVARLAAVPRPAGCAARTHPGHSAACPAPLPAAPPPSWPGGPAPAAGSAGSSARCGSARRCSARRCSARRCSARRCSARRSSPSLLRPSLPPGHGTPGHAFPARRGSPAPVAAPRPSRRRRSTSAALPTARQCCPIRHRRHRRCLSRCPIPPRTGELSRGAAGGGGGPRPTTAPRWPTG